MSKGLFVLPMVAMISAAAVGCQTGGASRPVNSVQPVKIIPWVECNWPDARLDPKDPRSPTYFEHVVSGLLIWKDVTDGAIVSTMPGTASLYTRLRKRVPGMRIIPGLKTMDLLPRFDSVQGWRQVAREVRAIQAVCGEKIILLENEHALAPYAQGEKALSTDSLKSGLAALPKDLEYWWYPPAVYWFSTKRGPDIGPEMCRAVQSALPKVRFIDQRFEAKHVLTYRQYIDAAKTLDSITQDAPLCHLFFYGPRANYVWWRDEQIHEALQCVRDAFGDEGVAIIYPGVKRWPEAARSLSQRLRSVRSAGQP